MQTATAIGRSPLAPSIDAIETVNEQAEYLRVLLDVMVDAFEAIDKAARDERAPDSYARSIAEHLANRGIIIGYLAQDALKKSTGAGAAALDLITATPHGEA